MKPIYILPFLLLIIPNAYAESTGFEEPVKEVFEWIKEAVQPSIDNSGFDDTTNDNLSKALDSGTDAGIKGTALWFGIHEFVVDLLFAGVSETDMPIDKDLIVIISMMLVFFMMLVLIKKLAKENTKLLVIASGVLLTLAILGIGLEF